MTDAASVALADALRAADPSAVGRALRHDTVVVGVMAPVEGEQQLQVLKTDAGFVLPVFSSTATLKVAYGDEAPYAVQPGSDLREFLTRHRDALVSVVFDASGPFPMQASVRDVLAVLEPQPGDDDVAWITGQPSSAVSSVDLRLPAGWASLAADPTERAHQLDALAGSVSRGARAWVRAIAPATESRGMFVRIERTLLSTAVIALDLTWHAGESAPASAGFGSTASGGPAVICVVPIPDGSGVVRLTFTSSDPSMLTVWFPKLGSFARGLAWQ